MTLEKSKRYPYNVDFCGDNLYFLVLEKVTFLLTPYSPPAKVLNIKILSRKKLSFSLLHLRKYPGKVFSLKKNSVLKKVYQIVKK